MCLLYIYIYICHKIVVGGKQGHAPCEILMFQQILFLRQLNFMEIIRMSQRLGEFGHAQFGDITTFKIVVFVCLSAYICV